MTVSLRRPAAPLPSLSYVLPLSLNVGETSGVEHGCLVEWRTWSVHCRVCVCGGGGGGGGGGCVICKQLKSIRIHLAGR